MYLDYFGLKEYPFRLNSDPRYLYLSKEHARVKAYIEYAIYIQDSILIITGEIGTGKTTLINDAISNKKRDVIIAKIHQTQLDEIELLKAVLVEFGLTPGESSKFEILEKLTRFIKQQHSRGAKVVLIVDEAQNLTKRVLEEIRLLSDIEHQNEKLLTVILVGQPELNTKLDAPGMEQLLQRVRLRFHITALREDEIKKYIKRRIAVAGGAEIVFSKGSIALIHRYSGGRPRLINVLCEHALTTAFVEGYKEISTGIINKVVEELKWKTYVERFGNDSVASSPDDPVSPDVDITTRVIVTLNGNVIGEYEITSEYISIGRHPDNDIHINDKTISRYHAQILTNQGDSYLRDMSSTNGTYIKSNRIDVCELTDGEVFTIGNYHFKYLRHCNYGGPDIKETSLAKS